jgi:hypothetical protein
MAKHSFVDLHVTIVGNYVSICIFELNRLFLHETLTSAQHERLISVQYEKLTTAHYSRLITTHKWSR